jgi:anti-sigma-K factor RskA
VPATLRGRRFERWRPGLAQAGPRCGFREEPLLPPAGRLRPVTPPSRVWRRICERLQLEPPRSAGSVPRRAWQPALAASLLLTAGLGAFHDWQAPGRITQQATITAASGAAAWTVEVHAPGLRGAQLIVRTGALPARPSGRDYELWVLPADGRPVSLGVLPATSGVSQHTLSTRQLAALAGPVQVAVSVEPAGGSPAGQPTGPVVLTAPLKSAS